MPTCGFAAQQNIFQISLAFLPIPPLPVWCKQCVALEEDWAVRFNTLEEQVGAKHLAARWLPEFLSKVSINLDQDICPLPVQDMHRPASPAFPYDTGCAARWEILGEASSR